MRSCKRRGGGNGKGLEIISPSARQQAGTAALLCQPPGRQGELSSLPSKEEPNSEGVEGNQGLGHLPLSVPGILRLLGMC